MPARKQLLEVAGREVTISNPDKLYFPRTGHTKLDLVRYYLAVADGAVRGVDGRPMALKRFVNGAEGEAFFQKRAPSSRPEWTETVELSFPSGRTADEIVVSDAAQLAWVVNLGCIDLNPHPIRAADLDHPDELRVDLDPVPGVGWPQIRETALLIREVLEAFGLVGWPKTSGSRGFHVYARIEPRWTFNEVRRAAVALAREVERQAPELATSRWWKEERQGVFIDYNQNAKDRTVASGYSVRPPLDHAADRDRQGGDPGRGDGRAGAVEGAPRRGLEPPGARRRAGRLHAWPQHHLVPDPAQPAQRAGARAAAPGAAGDRLRPLGRRRPPAALGGRALGLGAQDLTAVDPGRLDAGAHVQRVARPDAQAGRLAGRQRAELVVDPEDAGGRQGHGAQGGLRVQPLLDGQRGLHVQQVDRHHRVVGDDADLHAGGGQLPRVGE